MPQVEIVDGRQDAAVASEIPVGTIARPGMVERSPPRAVEAPAHGNALAIPERKLEPGVMHAGREKQALTQELPEGLTGDLLDDRRENAVPRVRVPEMSAGRKEQRRRELLLQELLTTH